MTLIKRIWVQFLKRTTQRAFCMCTKYTHAQWGDEYLLYSKALKSVAPKVKECLSALQPIKLSEPSGLGQSTVGSMSNSFSPKLEIIKTVYLYHSLVTVRLDFLSYLNWNQIRCRCNSSYDNLSSHQLKES